MVKPKVRSKSQARNPQRGVEKPPIQAQQTQYKMFNNIAQLKQNDLTMATNKQLTMFEVEMKSNGSSLANRPPEMTQFHNNISYLDRHHTFSVPYRQHT